MVWAKAVRAFGYIWCTLAGLLIIVGYGAIWWEHGFWHLMEILSPWNIVNYIAVVVTLAPGFGALMLAEKLELRAMAKGSNSQH